MTSKELQADGRANSEPGSDKRPLGVVARVLRHADDVPFGSPGNMLYDEVLSRRFHKGARTLAALAGMTCAFVVASWAFACMPSEFALGVPWADGGRVDSPLVSYLYLELRYYVPVLFGMLALPTFALASVRSIDLRTEFFYGEEPPSATIFDGNPSASAHMQVILWSGTVLIATGLCLAVATFPCGPLWGSPWERLAHVACCACMSVGSGLVATRVALTFIAARSCCIDDYDLLVPDCGADDNYKRRIYLDHATGISRLLGCAFALFGISRLLHSIPDDLGTVRMHGELLVESSSLSYGAARGVCAVKALGGLAPAILVAFALALLAKALLRSWRFCIEWSITEVPAYSDSYEAVRASSLVRAALSSCVCIALNFGGIALSGALPDGSFAGASISGLAAVIAQFAIGTILEVTAGFAITWVARYALTSRAAYDIVRSHISMFDSYAEVCLALDGLALVRRITYVLCLSSLAVSAIVVTSLVRHQPIISWGALASSALGMLGVL